MILKPAAGPVRVTSGPVLSSRRSPAPNRAGQRGEGVGGAGSRCLPGPIPHQLIHTDQFLIRGGRVLAASPETQNSRRLVTKPHWRGRSRPDGRTISSRTASSATSEERPSKTTACRRRTDGYPKTISTADTRAFSPRYATRPAPAAPIYIPQESTRSRGGHWKRYTRTALIRGSRWASRVNACPAPNTCMDSCRPSSPQ